MDKLLVFNLSHGVMERLQRLCHKAAISEFIDCSPPLPLRSSVMSAKFTGGGRPQQTTTGISGEEDGEEIFPICAELYRRQGGWDEGMGKGKGE